MALAPMKRHVRRNRTPALVAANRAHRGLVGGVECSGRTPGVAAAGRIYGRCGLKGCCRDVELPCGGLGDRGAVAAVARDCCMSCPGGAGGEHSI